MITLENVSKTYRTTEALSNINLSIASGTMNFLCGHSGAGKSTLLNLIGGSETPDKDSGKILINGVDLATLDENALCYFRQKIGFVDQSHHLIPDRTVFENISIPLHAMGLAQNKILKRSQTVLSTVEMLDKINHYPEQLSTGEQQRVSIARAVSNRPFILLADEPTGNLDQQLSIKIMQLLAKFQDIGSTIIVATHDTHIIQSMTYQTIYLEKGNLSRYE